MYQTKAALILASASPRRRELLSQLGLRFEVVPSGVNEGSGNGRSPEALALDWARAKAAAVAETRGKDRDQWLLAVDTIVVIDSLVLGKPRSREEAESFLGRLSGRWHEVLSAYMLWHPPSERRAENLVRSGVKIKELTPREIAAYLDTGEPFDKAGSYAVQGIGAFMVEEIRGSWTNVVGLPLTETVRDLSRMGVIALKGGT